MNRLNRIALCLTIFLANVNLPVYTAQTTGRFLPKLKTLRNRIFFVGGAAYVCNLENRCQRLEGRIKNIDENVITGVENQITADKRNVALHDRLWAKKYPNEPMKPYNEYEALKQGRQYLGSWFSNFTVPTSVQDAIKENPNDSSALALLRLQLRRALPAASSSPATVTPMGKDFGSKTGKNAAPTPTQPKADAIPDTNYNLFF